MCRLCLLAIAIVAGLAGCQRSPRQADEVQGERTSQHEMENAGENRRQEAERRRALAAQGEKVLPTLNMREDASRSATWFQGNVPADGSAAYLVCSRLGQQGAVSLRLKIRHVGGAWLNVAGCSVEVDGKDAGEFAPAKESLERRPDGRVIELLDADFENVRPIVLAMLDGQAATIHLRGENGNADVRLGDVELNEMRRVLAACEFLAAQPQ